MDGLYKHLTKYQTSQILLLIVFIFMMQAKAQVGSLEPQKLSKEVSEPLVIVTFGNSITATRNTVDQVFAQRLPKLLRDKGICTQIINSGVGGSHTGRLIDNDRVCKSDIPYGRDH